MQPISLYIDLEEGRKADLEVVARAAEAFVDAIREVAFIIDPSLEVRIELVDGTEPSLSLNSIIRAVNHRENRRDRRLSFNQSGKRRAVVIIRERDGKSLPAVFRSEGAALSWIKSRIAKGTVVNADEGKSWNDLHSRFEMKRINHEEAYSADGACTNMAEEFFSRMRRAEIGHHHHIAGTYLLRYAQEASWREDNRRVANGDQTSTVAALAMKRGAVSGFRWILAKAH